MRAVRMVVGALSLGLALIAQAADPVVGTAAIVVGGVSSTAPNGMSRPLKKNDALYSGDKVNTGAAAYVRLSFVDGSSMVLRPNTEFTIENFRFAASPSSAQPAASSAAPLQVSGQEQGGNQAIFRLVRGGLRAVSGLVGKFNRQEYAVYTPIATIGIRGTVYLTVTCDAVCAADSVVQSSLPAGETALGGTVSAVDEGGVVITSVSGKVANLDAAQFLLTTASGAQVMLPALPGFLVGEGWLAAEQAASALPEAAATTDPALASTTVSTLPVAASVATVVLTSAIAVAADSDDSGSVPPPSTMPPTGTTATAR